MTTTILAAAALALTLWVVVSGRVEVGARPAEVVSTPAATVYYVDSRRGSDDNSGASPSAAWKSIDRVNRAALAPGVRVLFAGGQTFAGTLRLAKGASGEKGHPVTISSFGKARPTLDGRTGDGVVLTDCAFVKVKNINVVGSGRKDGSDGAGIVLARTRSVELDQIEVKGFRLAGVSTGGDQDTRITRVHAHDNGGAGIAVHGGHDGLPRSKNVYIGDCVAENNPGDPKNLDNHSGNGIVVGGVDGCVIEYCEAMSNGWDMPRDGNGPVGIWGWNCDRLTIQHCISHHNKSPGLDGGGFDFDGGVTNSVMQYNLSYNNVGCGYLLCQYPGAATWKDNIVRYNISINDGSKSFQAGIGLWLGDQGIGDAEIYNNTVVNPVHAVATLGDLPRFVYRNNIFVSGGDILTGSFTQSRFESNLYWTTGKAAVYRDEKCVYSTLEEWSKATKQEVGVLADPKLALPSNDLKLPTDPRKLKELLACRLQAGSPAIAAGAGIPNNGGRDLFGNRLPAKGRPSLGAHEPQR